MVLKCPTCWSHWLHNGRKLAEYQCLMSNKHIIPEAVHPTLSDQSKPAGSDGMASAKQEGKQSHQDWHSDLYRAALHGDYNNGLSILDTHKRVALIANIDGHQGTALHVAVGSGPKSIPLVQLLVSRSMTRDLEMKNADGYTPLDIAAKVENVEAAQVLVEKHRNLVYIPSSNRKGEFPIHTAARYAQKQMLHYLLNVTKKEKGQSPDPYDPKGSGQKLLRLMIKAEFYEEASDLIKRVTQLAASEKNPTGNLLTISQNPSAFSCWRSDQGVLKKMIYACVPKPPQKESAKENLSDKSRFNWQRLQVLWSIWMQMLLQVLWGTFEKIAPALEHIKNEKLKGHQAKKLVKELCKGAVEKFKMPNDTILLFKMPLLCAAENGIHEMVKEFIDTFPHDVWCDGGDLLTLAIQYRHHDLYLLLLEMGVIYVDQGRQKVEEATEDNILHLAGRLPASDRHGIISGAALQMQKDLTWFEEIKSLVQPSNKNKINKDGKIPQEVFTECHKKQMADAEKWVKETANSCMIVAVLIVTVSFAAFITVPGGIRADNGRPMFGSEMAFKIFGVANAVSSFASCASLLTFLSILTSRYTEGDFLLALPMKLVVGLLSLFISVASMMSAFPSMLYLMFGDGNEGRWVLGCAIGPCILLVAMFAFGHFSLVGEIIKNTRLSGNLKKKSKSEGRKKEN